MAWDRLAGFWVLGILVWTLVEYLLHRYGFHTPTSSPAGNRAHFLAHGIHHYDPFDGTRLLFPPLGGLGIAAVIYLGFYLVMPLDVSLILMSGLLTGYLIYDFSHYISHHGKIDGPLVPLPAPLPQGAPPSGPGRLVRRIQPHCGTGYSGPDRINSDSREIQKRGGMLIPPFFVPDHAAYHSRSVSGRMGRSGPDQPERIGDLPQAAGIRSHHQIRPGGRQVGGLASSQIRGNFRIPQPPGSPAAATDLGFRRFDQSANPGMAASKPRGSATIPWPCRAWQGS